MMTMGEDTTRFNVQTNLQGLPFKDLVEMNAKSRLPYAVCVLNLNGDLNTGIIIRTANLMGAERVIVFGRRKYDRRSAVGTQNYIDIDQIEGFEEDGVTLSISKFEAAMKQFDYDPIFIENSENAFDIQAISAFVEQKKLCLVFGNESDGIPNNFLQTGMNFTIPQRGIIRCMNVSTAASIAMWEMQKCYV